jgi:hypothetical protein
LKLTDVFVRRLPVLVFLGFFFTSTFAVKYGWIRVQAVCLHEMGTCMMGWGRDIERSMINMLGIDFIANAANL